MTTSTTVTAGCSDLVFDAIRRRNAGDLAAVLGVARQIVDDDEKENSRQQQPLLSAASRAATSSSSSRTTPKKKTETSGAADENTSPTALLDLAREATFVDAVGRSFLFRAVESGYLELVRIVLAFLKAKQQEEEKHQCRDNNNNDKNSLQTDAQVDDALLAAATNGNLDMILLLLNQSSADVNARDRCGHSVLHGVASAGHVKALTVMIRKGLRYNNNSFHPDDVDETRTTTTKATASTSVDTSGNTPLHLCCANGHVNFTNLLLANGGGGGGGGGGCESGVAATDPVAAINNAGLSVLHAAVLNGRTEIVSLLLDYDKTKKHQRRYSPPPPSRTKKVLPGFGFCSEEKEDAHVHQNNSNNSYRNSKGQLQHHDEDAPVPPTDDDHDDIVSVQTCDSISRNTPLIDAIRLGHNDIVDLIVDHLVAKNHKPQREDDKNATNDHHHHHHHRRQRRRTQQPTFVVPHHPSPVEVAVTFQNAQSTNAVQFAVLAGNTRAVKKILSAMPSMHAARMLLDTTIDDEGNTLVHTAVSLGYLSIVRALCRFHRYWITKKKKKKEKDDDDAAVAVAVAAETAEEEATRTQDGQQEADHDDNNTDFEATWGTSDNDDESWFFEEEEEEEFYEDNDDENTMEGENPEERRQQHSSISALLSSLSPAQFRTRLLLKKNKCDETPIMIARQKDEEVKMTPGGNNSSSPRFFFVYSHIIDYLISLNPRWKNKAKMCFNEFGEQVELERGANDEEEEAELEADDEISDDFDDNGEVSPENKRE